MREKILLDSGWKFHYGEIDGSRNDWGWCKSGSWNQGPESRDYDDSKWEEVCVPHDFVIHTEPVRYMEKQFGEDNVIPAMDDVYNMHTTSGSFQREVGWYRRRFTIPKEDEGRKLYLVLEGAYRDSSVYLNNFLIGKERSGYKQIVIDITDTVEYGGENVLAVRTDARESEGWFYEGGGLYRDVYLLKTENEHIADAFVWNEVDLEENRAEVFIQVELERDDIDLKEIEIFAQAESKKGTDIDLKGCGDTCKVPEENTAAGERSETQYRVCISLTDKDGKQVVQKEQCVTKEGWSFYEAVNSYRKQLTIKLPVEAPNLWSPENPALYQVKTVLWKEMSRKEVGEPGKSANGEQELVEPSGKTERAKEDIQQAEKADKKLDEYIVRTGIRKIAFDAEKGFLLNGSQVKIKGVCCHQNHGGLGTALPDEVYRYRIGRLKEMGANGYRCSHYPPTPALLDICDEMGMLVMDETRLLSSEKEDLEQLGTMVKRDRNHPSVILYSIGNEEAQSQATEQGARIAGSMIRRIKELDPHTPVTMALLMWDLGKRVRIENIHALRGIAKQLDVAGFNYQDWAWEPYHKEFPDQPMICTEQGTFKSTRGCYQTQKELGHLAITDKNSDSYMLGAQQWAVCRPDWMSGLFLWTGFDYYGEPSPFAWPAISSQFGIMDLCGYPKDFYYYYKAWWRKEPLLHIFPDWNGEPGEKKDVYVFSNCREVELFCNGVSLGRKKMEQDGYLIWEQVTYEPGVLEGVGYGSWFSEVAQVENSSTEEAVIREKIETTGTQNQIRLRKDYAEGQIYLLRAEVVDKKGNIVPNRDSELTFTVDHGRILGTSNGDPSDHMPPSGNVRRTFHGLAQVILRGEGPVTVSVFEKDRLVCREKFCGL